MSKNAITTLELWGGPEYSCVRLGDRLTDQLARSGHDRRVDDLTLFAETGFRALRYPVLWEHHATEPIDWRWADERLHRLRELGIRPIVGLVHHGGGPLPDGLLDPGFTAGLARFAGQVAERYPWVDAYTPVNEPMTTARFSGLYGIWHPHRAEPATFARCFMQQCEATRAAMAAIRTVNPRAQLIQTEDVGKTHSTPLLAYQAEYENNRRLLTFDLLCGLIDRHHPMWPDLIGSGVTEAELRSFLDEPCPPDVLGMNYYVTSERFLDHRLEHYPSTSHGGNGRHHYADVPAVRVRQEGLNGPATLLREVWDRYHRPIAITEVQLACAREEQLRWLHEIWNTAQAARQDGIDVRAVTAWALLGAFDWDSLLCLPRDRYENGAYDVRAPRPRRTALAHALADLSRGQPISHPVVSVPGWWRRSLRFEYPPVSAPATGPGTAVTDEFAANAIARSRPIAILGAGGRLGRAFLRHCHFRGLNVIAVSRRQLDIATPGAARKFMERTQPAVVINCAGYRHIDQAERAADVCGRENVVGLRELAATCAEARVPLATFSSDQVFCGQADRPHVESDAPDPVNEYGRSKLRAEIAVRELCPDALILRLGALFSLEDEDNFLSHVLRSLSAGRPVKAPAAWVVSPVFLPDLVDTVLDLVIDQEKGIWHVANQGSVSWFEWATRAAALADLDGELVREAQPHEMGWMAPRPKNAALASERGTLLPPWEEAVARFVAAFPRLTSGDVAA